LAFASRITIFVTSYTSPFRDIISQARSRNVYADLCKYISPFLHQCYAALQLLLHRLAWPAKLRLFVHPARKNRGGNAQPGSRPFPFPRVLGDKTADSFRSRGSRGQAAAPNTSTSIAVRARPTEKSLLRHRLFTLEVDYTHGHECFSTSRPRTQRETRSRPRRSSGLWRVKLQKKPPLAVDPR